MVNDRESLTQLYQELMSRGGVLIGAARSQTVLDVARDLVRGAEDMTVGEMLALFVIREPENPRFFDETLVLGTSNRKRHAPLAGVGADFYLRKRTD